VKRDSLYAYPLYVATCELGHEIVLPYATPLHKSLSPRVSATGVPYIDLACPQCKQVFRRFVPQLQMRVFDRLLS
jgi:hypothetical protein